MSERMQADWPVAERPQMTDYGVPTDATGMLPWHHAVERLEQSRTYWIATNGPHGQPHAVPVWGVWIENVLYFGTSPSSRTARNLAHNPAVAVHLESGDQPVFLEGRAESIAAFTPERFAPIAQAFVAKFGGEAPDSPDAFFAVRPRVVFAWTDFPDTVTRWRFPGA